MSPFDLQPDAPWGECRFCHSRALYVNLTCDNCGTRLPWADDVADQLGENCPNCKHFNVYTHRVCSNCGAFLPWRECVAAVYNSTRNAERQFKGTLWWILAALLIMVAGTMGIVWISAPPR